MARGNATGGYSINNLDAIAETIGQVRGMCKAVEAQRYLNDLVTQAHGETVDAFDLAAAATARAGKFRHMYEYGVAGITGGPVKFTDPTSQAARLWENKLVGAGTTWTTTFMFRPAVVRNPQQTTKVTGVKSHYLRKLSKRKYVFWNKAFVTETGREVKIRAKNTEKLFVPFGADKPARNPAYAAKHFVFWDSSKKGPIINEPGETTHGNFTAFRFAWWASEGQQLMNKNVMTTLNKDIALFEKKMKAAAKAVPMKRASANNPNSTADRASTKAQKSFGKGITR